MSAPNKQYDPVEVAVLSPDEVAGMRDAALAAIAAAGSLDELKTARLAHAGDRSPLALATSTPLSSNRVLTFPMLPAAAVSPPASSRTSSGIALLLRW